MNPPHKEHDRQAFFILATPPFYGTLPISHLCCSKGLSLETEAFMINTGATRQCGIIGITEITRHPRGSPQEISKL